MTSIRRVLILDDVAQTREWLAAIIAEAFSGAEVAFADSVAQALAGRPLQSTAMHVAALERALARAHGEETQDA